MFPIDSINRRISKRIIFYIALFNIVLLFTFTFYYKIVTEPREFFKIDHTDIYELMSQIRITKCIFPKLNPFGKEVLPYLSVPDLVNCAHSANPGGEILFKQERGTRTLIKLREVDADCCYRPFHRVNDDSNVEEQNCVLITNERTEIPLDIEFIEVICVGGREDYRDGFAFVHKKPELEDWLKNVDEANGRSNNSDGDRMSVIILGLDATSRMNFLRTLPKSNKYLLKNMSAIVLKGYTKVAENTLPNVIPLLSGQTLTEFKKGCIPLSKHSSEVHLDNCLFIWNGFSAAGYRTGFAEDDVTIGIFNMNWNRAFIKPPVDYYLRPFSRLMQNRQNSAHGHCYGTRLSFKVLLDNLEHMATALNNSLYFQFTWATKLSHSNYNMLSLGDIPLLNFLKFMRRSGSLNNTALIIMSDHGSRLDDIRSTPQGKIEDRMPLFYLVLPKWFPQKYKKAWENLQNNSDRLTSPFDVHKTLQDFMDLRRIDNDNLNSEADFSQAFGLDQNFEKVVIRRAYSLFDSIPENRTCLEAGIPLHWCVCHGTRSQCDFGSSEVATAVKYAVDSMNYFLRGQKDCATLFLVKILDAFYIDADSSSSSKRDSKVKEVEVLVGSDGVGESIDSGIIIIRVSFWTSPGDGLFEATMLRKNESGGKWMLTEQVVRTNEYGDQSECVEQMYKEFCYCK